MGDALSLFSPRVGRDDVHTGYNSLHTQVKSKNSGKLDLALSPRFAQWSFAFILSFVSNLRDYRCTLHEADLFNQVTSAASVPLVEKSTTVNTHTPSRVSGRKWALPVMR